MSVPSFFCGNCGETGTHPPGQCPFAPKLGGYATVGEVASLRREIAELRGRIVILENSIVLLGVLVPALQTVTTTGHEPEAATHPADLTYATPDPVTGRREPL
jgi:hypothetical protein